MTVSSRGPWLTDRPNQAPPRKSATSHPGQQAPHEYPTHQPAPAVAAGQVLNAQLPGHGHRRQIQGDSNRLCVSPYAFAAAFRRHHGRPPGQWRQQELDRPDINQAAPADDIHTR